MTTKGTTVQRGDEDSFVSEAVYAEELNGFTRVSCGDIYAFSSIATSGDFSETTTTLSGVTQYGVEITFPNGQTDLLVFQLGNLLRTDPKTRKQTFDAIFNKGDIWVTQFDELFSEALFPKTWDYLVAPTKEDVESIANYSNNSYLDYGPLGKHEITLLTATLSVTSIIGVSTLLSAAVGSIIGLIVTLGLFLTSYLLYPKFSSFIEEKTALDTPHFWGQRMSIDENELEDAEPISGEFRDRTQAVLFGFSDKWTEVTVESVSEAPDETTLKVITRNGEDFNLYFRSPSTSSSRFTLNWLVNELGVGSVQMLENEEIKIGTPRVNRTQEKTSLKDEFRVKPI